jgi:hypothetical protein
VNFDPHQHHALSIYAATMFFYTFAVFFIPFGRKNAPFFSHRRMKRPSVLIWTHMGFLSIFAASMLLAFYIYPLLPNWSTVELYRGRGGSHTASGIAFFIFVFLLGAIERLFIYLESEGEDSDSSSIPRERH